MKSIFVLGLLCIAAASCSLAFSARQGGELSDVMVTVRDQAGAGIPKAQVRIDPLPQNIEKSLVTDADGKLRLTIPPGDYDVVIMSPGFKTATEHLELQGVVRRDLEIVLKIGDTCSGGCPILTPQKVIDATRQRARPQRGRGPFPGSESPGHSVGLPIKLQLLVPVSVLRPDGTEAVDFLIKNIGSDPIKLPSSVLLTNSEPHEVLTLWVTSDAIKDQFFTDTATGRLVKIATVPISAELGGSSDDPNSFDVLGPDEYILVHGSSPELKEGTHSFTAHAELLQISNGKSELTGAADSEPATTTLVAASSNSR